MEDGEDRIKMEQRIKVEDGEERSQVIHRSKVEDGVTSPQTYHAIWFVFPIRCRVCFVNRLGACTI